MATKAKNMLRHLEENHKGLGAKAIEMAKKNVKMSKSKMLWSLAGAAAIIGAGVAISYARKRYA